MHIKVFCESATIKDCDNILENMKHLSFPQTSYFLNKDFFSRKLLPLWKKKKKSFTWKDNLMVSRGMCDGYWSEDQYL